VNEDPKMDLEEWEPQLPPADFADRVMERVRPVAVREVPSPVGDKQENRAKAKSRRWGMAAGVTGALALAAALAVRVTAMPDSHGEAIAKDRLEVSIGSRARAVLEPGAEVKWDGDDVVQAHGDVFYRVEPGARFRVHTPAGDVEVKGTCFAVKIRGEATASKVEGATMDKRDVKSGVIGAAITALAFVAVYEGKVAVSHASERVDLGAGETARVSGDGVQRSGKLAEGEKAFDAKAAAELPLAQANDNLVAQVSEYRARLEAIAEQKIALEQTLKNTEQKLAARADGAAPTSRAEFDLGTDEWKELAKDGTVKFMRPCKRPASRVASPEMLQKVALAPDDAPVLKSAYEKSNQRLWGTIRPLCGEALGSLEVADKVGLDTCTHLILDVAQGKEPEATNEAMRQVGEIRAGLRPAPGPNDPISPVAKMFLALTGELKLFEAELAQTMGQAEAHRVAYADGMCMQSSTFGGPGPRDPQKK
jgi:ferric-dicitrate binding protein FerR (iron transport regulator)